MDSVDTHANTQVNASPAPVDYLVYELEVDVATRRPPTPANTRTHHVTIAVIDQGSWTRADNEARTLGALMCHRRGPMVTAVRIASVEL